MAEDQEHGEGAGQSDGTAAGRASDTGIQSTTLTLDDVRSVLQGELVKFYQEALDPRLTRTEQRAARIDGLAQQLAEVTGSVRKAEAMIERVYAGVGTEADVAAVKQGVDSTLERERLEADRKALDARQKALTEYQARVQGGHINEAVWESFKDDLRDYAKDAGVDFEKAYQQNAQAHLVNGEHRLPNGSTADPTGMTAYKRAFRKVVESMAKANEEAEKPRVRVDPTRPAGGGQAKRVTREDIGKMTPEEYRKNRDAIFAQMGR